MAAKQKICGNCIHADKSKGIGFWICTNQKPRDDKECKTPTWFPRVLTNNSCKYFEKPKVEKPKKEKPNEQNATRKPRGRPNGSAKK